MIRSLTIAFGLVSAVTFLPASRSAAQAPNLYLMQRVIDSAGQSECATSAVEALTAASLYDVTTGSEEDAGSKFASGLNSNVRAVIACSKNSPQVATVVVTGSEGHRDDVNNLGEYLTNYMLGQKDGKPGLSSSEAPVKMNEWLTDDWCLGCEGSETEKRYSGEIQRPARSMRVRVRSGRAESGNGSVEVLVYDPSGKLVLTEATNHDDWAEWRVGVIDYGRFEIVLRSLSSREDGESVSNEGEIQVLVR